ncbi:MAG: nucleotidyltransferase domain-containing protein [Synergistaceae bacterium]|nr:nucleotidyltransferase domain-containing protein [Synergistaceae bacterium]
MPFTIDEIGNKIIPIAKTYGIESVSLFGSYARGEANADSDVDILINKGKLSGLIQYFSFVQELEDALGCHVDVVTSGIEDKKFLKDIQREEVWLYGDK